jgi:outer membrane immunogenic protein
MRSTQVTRLATVLAMTVIAPMHALADGPASADPVIVTPPVVEEDRFWEGPWVGAHIGMGSTNYDISGSVYNGSGTLGEVNLPDLGGQGPLFGIQAGYGFRISPTLIGGIQLDASMTDITNDTYLYIAGDAIGPGSPEIAATYELQPRTMYGLSARLGYLTSPDTQVYGLVGYGQANFRGTLDLEVDGTSTFGGQYDFNGNGMILGVGIETRIGRSTSLGIEYRYSDFGRHSFFDEPIIGGTMAEVGFDMSVQSVRMVLNYRF